MIIITVMSIRTGRGPVKLLAVLAAAGVALAASA